MNEMTYEEMALLCSTLMDEVEKSGYAGSSDDGYPPMVKIMELANLLQMFAPELLDPRFG